MKTVVLTGASGFVGSNLSSQLKQLGANVIAVSRRQFSGMIKVDDYADSPMGDVLVHLGEESDRALVNRQGESYLNEANRVVQTLLSRGYKRVIYASSGAVYGDNNPKPNKTGDAVFANDIYNKVKLSNEELILAAGGLVVRLSNLYGEGMAVNTVVSNILFQVPGEGPLSVHDVAPVRDYLHISDAVKALALAAYSDHSGIINVGTGIGTNVRRLAEIACVAACQPDREVKSIMSFSRTSINILDISDTRIILDWTPRADLAECLRSLLIRKM